jgi:phosphopantetheinyl transferase
MRSVFLERDRRNYAAAQALLREALSFHGRRAPSVWQLGTSSAGKPFLAGEQKLEFNIAHTPGLVAAACP